MNGDEITVRLARPEDSEACEAIERAVWSTFHDQAEGNIWIDYDPELHVVAERADGTIVATGDACPFAWDGRPETLPYHGWAEVIERAYELRETNAPKPAFACALGISILPDARGTGLGLRMLSGLREAATAAGYKGLAAPVRPTEAWRMPHMTMAEFSRVRLPDGRHFDPWIRVHERAGGTIIGSCEDSITLQGSREQWEEWTGLRLPEQGFVLVDGANAYLTLGGGIGVLTEGSVWLLHELG